MVKGDKICGFRRFGGFRLSHCGAFPSGLAVLEVGLVAVSLLGFWVGVGKTRSLFGDLEGQRRRSQRL
ncbi:hypothetical protein NL676_035583 [Syzygium grande]|nr:hypothetical protein NL676_035583 [Syzygium grande]